MITESSFNGAITEVPVPWQMNSFHSFGEMQPFPEILGQGDSAHGLDSDSACHGAEQESLAPEVYSRRRMPGTSVQAGTAASDSARSFVAQ